MFSKILKIIFIGTIIHNLCYSSELQEKDEVNLDSSLQAMPFGFLDVNLYNNNIFSRDIENIHNISQIDSTNYTSAENIKAMRTVLDNQQDIIDNLQQRLVNLQNNFSVLVDHYENNMNQIQASFINVDNTQREQQNTMLNINNKISKIENDITLINTKLSNIHNNQIEPHNTRLNLNNNISKLEHNIKSMNTKFSDIHNAQMAQHNKILNINNKISKFENNIKSINNKLSNTHNTQMEQHNQILNINNKISKFESNNEILTSKCSALRKEMNRTIDCCSKAVSKAEVKTLEDNIENCKHVIECNKQEQYNMTLENNNRITGTFQEIINSINLLQSNYPLLANKDEINNIKTDTDKQIKMLESRIEQISRQLNSSINSSNKKYNNTTEKSKAIQNLNKKRTRDRIQTKKRNK